MNETRSCFKRASHRESSAAAGRSAARDKRDKISTFALQVGSKLAARTGRVYYPTLRVLHRVPHKEAIAAPRKRKKTNCSEQRPTYKLCRSRLHADGVRWSISFVSAVLHSTHAARIGHGDHASDESTGCAERPAAAAAAAAAAVAAAAAGLFSHPHLSLGGGRGAESAEMDGGKERRGEEGREWGEGRTRVRRVALDASFLAAGGSPQRVGDGGGRRDNHCNSLKEDICGLMTTASVLPGIIYSIISSSCL